MPMARSVRTPIGRTPRIELSAAVSGGTLPEDELGEPLGIAAVAGLIGCSPWTVRHGLIPQGLPCFRSAASGRLIFYRQQVVRWILRQQRRQGGPQR